VQVALYLFEAGALTAVLAINRYYNLFGTLTIRQAIVLVVPLAVCLASASYVVLRFRRATTSESRSLSFALATNLVAVILLAAGSELVVRALSVREPAGASFAGTTLLPKSWEEVKARNAEILSRVPPNISYFVADDLLGWVPGPARRSADGRYSSSAEGLRSSSPAVAYASRSARHRVAIAGDSFTFGLEVPFEDSWGAVLETALGPDVAVLNFGVDGYGVDQAFLRYERDARPWKPAVVILGFIDHDLYRTLSVYSFVTFPEWGFPFSKPRFVMKGGTLERLTTRLESPTDILTKPLISDLPFIAFDPGYDPDEWERHVYHASFGLRFLLSRLARWPPQGAGTHLDELERINIALISRFRELAEADGTRPLVVFFPSRGDFTGGDRPARDAVFAALGRAGVEYIDLTSCVARVGVDTAFIPDRPHYSAEGNAAVAKCLLPAVRDALTP